MPAAELVLHVLFAVFLTFMILEDGMLGRALWAIPAILVYQTAMIMNRVKLISGEGKLIGRRSGK